MELVNIGNKNSIFNQFVANLRDENAQKNKALFRFNMERASEILAYELSHRLRYETKEVITPLGSAEINLPVEQPMLVSILRAALAMQMGFLRIFDQADNAFISAYRKYKAGDKFDIHVEYVSSPGIDNRTIILLDPMIATGKSMVLSYEQMLRFGRPKQVFISSLIVSEESLDYVERHIPEAIIFVGAVDSELTAKSYIVPGLGDAGDLAFGEKT